MQIDILGEYGYEFAMRGLALSYNQSIGKMSAVAKRLYNKDGGHNKFLESMVVTLDIDAPRYWWSEFDTYRVGVTKQSESTMHTLTKRRLVQSDFASSIHESYLAYLNVLIERGDLIEAKRALPESFYQRRIVQTNYKTLRNMMWQRLNHKLPEWKIFVSYLVKHLKYSEFVSDISGKIGG